MKDRSKEDQAYLDHLLAGNASASGKTVATQTAQTVPASQPTTAPQTTYPAQTAQPATTSRGAIRRLPKIKGSNYEKLMHKIGILVGFFIAGGMWYAGAFFTLQWISSLGFDVNFGVSAWWLIPIAVTSFEVGLQTARHPAAILTWLVVLAFDIATTSIGLHHFASARGIAMPAFEFWLLSSMIGFQFALAPERLGRAFYIELMR
jgi:hypothetical protein